MHRCTLELADELAAILTQRLSRMDVTRPRFAVRVGHEARHVTGFPRGAGVRMPHKGRITNQVKNQMSYIEDYALFRVRNEDQP